MMSVTIEKAFNANYYRHLYSDIASFTEEEAWQHWQIHGIGENRQFSPLVNLEQYRAFNADLQEMDAPSLLEHLVNFGLNENRRFSPHVDLNYYRSIHADLTDLTPAEAFKHLFEFGIDEGRRFSPHIDLNYYRSIHADLTDLTPGEAFEHLFEFGINEGRSFSPNIDLNYYRSIHADLTNFSLKQAVEHLFTFGMSEGRIYFPIPESMEETESTGVSMTTVEEETSGSDVSDFNNINSDNPQVIFADSNNPVVINPGSGSSNIGPVSPSVPTPPSEDNSSPDSNTPPEDSNNIGDDTGDTSSGETGDDTGDTSSGETGEDTGDTISGETGDDTGDTSSGETGDDTGEEVTNTAPTLDSNATRLLELAQGTTATITQGQLKFIDDQTTDANQLVYQIEITPSKGILQLNGQTLSDGDTFTQADINAGLLEYVQSESFSIPPLTRIDNGTTNNFQLMLFDGKKSWIGDTGSGYEFFTTDGTNTSQLTNNNLSEPLQFYSSATNMIYSNGDYYEQNDDGSLRKISTSSDNSFPLQHFYSSNQMSVIYSGKNGAELELFTVSPGSGLATQLTDNNFTRISSARALGGFEASNLSPVYFLANQGEGSGLDLFVTQTALNPAIQLTSENFTTADRLYEIDSSSPNPRLIWQGNTADSTNMGFRGDIFVYDTQGSTNPDLGELTQLTTTGDNQIVPVYQNGNFIPYWIGGDGTGQELFRYDGNQVEKLTNENFTNLSPRLMSEDWMSSNILFEGDGEIYFYNGTSTTQLSTTSTDNRLEYVERSNSSKYWTGNDGSGRELFTYNGTTPTQITSGNFDSITGLRMDWGANGNLFFIADGEIYRYDGTTKTLLTSESTENGWLFNAGIFDESGNSVPDTFDDLFWVGNDGSGQEIYRYDGSTVQKLTDADLSGVVVSTPLGGPPNMSRVSSVGLVGETVYLATSQGVYMSDPMGEIPDSFSFAVADETGLSSDTTRFEINIV